MPPTHDSLEAELASIMGESIREEIDAEILDHIKRASMTEKARMALAFEFVISDMMTEVMAWCAEHFIGPYRVLTDRNSDGGLVWVADDRDAVMLRLAYGEVSRLSWRRA